MTPTLPDVAKVEAAIFVMTNAFRQDNQLAAVKPNPLLAAAARAYGEYLARTGQFSHTADGRQPVDRATAAGYQSCLVAENLAYFLDSRGFETQELAKKSVTGWINSPGHRKNMLTPDATEIGVAVVKAPDPNPKYISVQLFGRPLSLRLSFQVANRAGVPVTYAFQGERTEVRPNMVMSQSSCADGPIKFEAALPGLAAGSWSAQFKPHNGQVFTLTAGAGGAIKVEVGTLKAGP